MNPITKFEWKDNIEQEKDLLEYISILEELYIPDFDHDTDSPYYYGYERINKSEVSVEEWEEICNQPIYTSNPQLSSSASFLRLNVLSSLN